MSAVLLTPAEADQVLKELKSANRGLHDSAYDIIRKYGDDSPEDIQMADNMGNLCSAISVLSRAIKKSQEEK